MFIQGYPPLEVGVAGAVCEKLRASLADLTGPPAASKVPSSADIIAAPLVTLTVVV